MLPAWLLWLALGVCFSPVLIDLVQHLAANPWAAYVVIFPPLLARCALRDPPGARSVHTGAALLATGLAIELVAVGGGVVRLGRLGLPVAVVGLSRAFGLLSSRTALLSVWWVPVPHAVISFPSPALETAWLQGAAWPLNLLGANVTVEAGLARAGTLELLLSAAETGIPLAALLSGLGWYASARLGETLWRCLRGAVIWGLLAFPIQTAAVGLALTGLVLGVPSGLPQLFLGLLWIPTAAIGLLASEPRPCTGGIEP